MKRWLFCVVPVAIAAMQLGCSDTPKALPDTRAADEKAIRDLETQWVKDLQTKDADKATANYDNDASFLPTNMPLVNGKTAITRVYRELLTDPNGSLDFSTAKVQVSRSGDLAFTEGTYTMRSTDPKTKRPATEKGKYLVVYKKAAGGTWKVIEDSAVADAPPAVEGGGKVAKAAAPKSTKKAKKAKR